MKNLNVILAKKYIDNYYALLSKHVNEKELKEIKKKVSKYEDVSYLKSLNDPAIKETIISWYESNKENNIDAYTKLIQELDAFYDNHFLNKEIIDVALIKKELNNLDKQLVSASKEEYLHEINQLHEFKNNISVELEVYVSKHKAEEYMDMSIFHRSVSQIIEDNKNTLKVLIEDNKLENEEYYDHYLEFVYQQFNVIFESASNKNKSMPQWLKGLIFCTPWIIGFLVFTIYPLIQTLLFSFSNVNLTPDGFVSNWVGFKNYFNIFTSDTDFILALKSYLVTMIIYVPLITIFSLMLAMMLNSKIKTKGLFRTIFFLPVVITSGPVMRILIEQGVTAMPGVNTLVNVEEMTSNMPELMRMAFNVLTSEFIMILWFSGIQILVFLTGLQKIDKGVYEASAIDGANKWEQFWKVTLPAINPTIVINVVFTTVMQSIFALNPIILKIQTDMNDTAEGKGYGYSSALAFTYFMIMVVTLVIFVLIFKKHEKKGRRAR